MTDPAHLVGERFGLIGRRETFFDAMFATWHLVYNSINAGIDLCIIKSSGISIREYVDEGKSDDIGKKIDRLRTVDPDKGRVGLLNARFLRLKEWIILRNRISHGYVHFTHDEIVINSKIRGDKNYVQVRMNGDDFLNKLEDGAVLIYVISQSYGIENCDYDELFAYINSIAVYKP